MAKDPAFLFYPGDWQGGTMTMSRHVKGCYIDLLVAQFNSGPLSLEEIKIVLGTDFAVWGSLSKKFKQTGNGLFFNERLEAEKTKRAEYSLKQKERINKRWNKSGTQSGNTTVLPSENEDENEDEKENAIDPEVALKNVSRETETLPGEMVWGDEIYRPSLYRLAEAYSVPDVRNLLDRWEGWYVNKFQWRDKTLHEMRLSFEGWIKDPKSRSQNGKSYNKNDRTEFNQNEFAIITAHAGGSGGPEKP